jgi:hypothetical protein
VFAVGQTPALLIPLFFPHPLYPAIPCVGTHHITAKRVKKSCVIRIYGISLCPNEEERAGALVVMAIDIVLPFDEILTLFLKLGAIWCF